MLELDIMAMRCDICGKGKTTGKSGAHQYGGGWAMRAQKTKKTWKPNLQPYTIDGVMMKLCTRCLKWFKKQKKDILLKKTAKTEPSSAKTITARKTVKKSSKSAK